MNELDIYLRPNFFEDADHPAVLAYAREHTQVDSNDVENAVSLYYAIRDGFRYNPWDVVPLKSAFKASFVALRDRRRGGHCIDKANLLAACARGVGIPSRLHFANVRNHIGTEALERLLGTDVLVFHGYAELFLEGRWVAATPAFNKELCDHLGVAPLEFDGRKDSIFQQYDRQGGKFMEYLHDYGTFAELPFELMISEWRRHYAAFREGGEWPTRALDQESLYQTT